MFIKLNQNFCELIANNNFNEDYDFYTIEDLYDDDKYDFTEILFQKDEPLFDIFKNVKKTIKKIKNINIVGKKIIKRKKRKNYILNIFHLKKSKI